MRVAMLPTAGWRISPEHHEGPRETIVSLLTKGLASRGVEVTLFLAGDSDISDTLSSVDPRSHDEGTKIDPRVWECLHFSKLFERADDFDLIHNHAGCLPLSYSGLIETPVLTTIHGISSQGGVLAYKKYNRTTYYVSVSHADRSPELDYAATIYLGADLDFFTFNAQGGESLLFCGRIHPEAGTREAIQIAYKAGRNLLIAGTVQDQQYFNAEVEPHLDGRRITYLGSVRAEERSALLGSVLALLHPIGFDEPFGTSVVEANACGTPVIAFARGSMQEIITDGRNGCLVCDEDEAADAVTRVTELSRVDCRRIVEERFSQDRMVEEYLKVYARILEETKREDHRPWGYYKVLSDLPDHKVKRLVVYPGKRLSLQRHSHRSERWTVISGSPIVTCGKEEIALKAGESIEIPRGAMHRISNQGRENVVVIEVQLGDYLGEDDIERFDDDFGRADTSGDAHNG